MEPELDRRESSYQTCTLPHTPDGRVMHPELEVPSKNTVKVDKVFVLLDLLNDKDDFRFNFLSFLGCMYLACMDIFYIVIKRLRREDPTLWWIMFWIVAVATFYFSIRAWSILQVAMEDSSYSNKTELTHFTVHGVSMHGQHVTPRSMGNHSPRTNAKILEGEPLLTHAKGERILQLDYMKLVVNFIVVFHHTYTTCQGGSRLAQTPMRIFGLFVEPFVMQAASFASGVVYTPAPNARRCQSILKLVAGYFVLQVMYLLLLKFVAFEQRVGDAEQCYKQATIYHTPEDPLPWYQVLVSTINPFWHLWYIWSLFMWRILIPYWMHLEYPVTFAILLSALSGWWDIVNLATSRVMGYFPFFVLGVVLKQHGYSHLVLQLLCNVHVQLWALTMFLVHAVLSVLGSMTTFNPGYFMHIYNYRSLMFEESGHSDAGTYWIVMFTKLACYPIGGVLILCLLAVMPVKDSWLREAGERTLGPYLLHFIVVIIVRAYTHLLDNLEFINTVLLGLLMLTVVVFLYLPWVHSFTQFIILPPLDQMGLFRGQADIISNDFKSLDAAMA